MLDRNQKKQNQEVINLLEEIIQAIHNYLQQNNNLDKFFENKNNRKTNIYNIISLVYEAFFNEIEAKAMATATAPHATFYSLRQLQSKYPELKEKTITSHDAKTIITKIIALFDESGFKTGLLNRSALRDSVLKVANFENIDGIIQREARRLENEKNILSKPSGETTSPLEKLPTEIRDLVLQHLDETSLSKASSASSTLFKSSKALRENTHYWQTRIKDDLKIENIDDERLNPNESNYDLYQRLADTKKILLYVVVDNLANPLDIINKGLDDKISEQKILHNEEDVFTLLTNAVMGYQKRYIIELVFENKKEKDLFINEKHYNHDRLGGFAKRICSIKDLTNLNVEKVPTTYFRGKLIEKPAKKKPSEPNKPSQ